MKTVSIKLREEIIELLDKFAVKYGMNRSELLRMILEWYVDLIEKGEGGGRFSGRGRRVEQCLLL